ncbi:MAG: O-methyltransferase [Lachnospiraceae bacterium]|nr:O-methyltransferase [Lachnospiraceae bacterium]
MISNERRTTFINSLDEGNSPFLDQIEKEAIEGNVPIIRKDMQGFLRFILSVRKPRRILEVGTATGFSALLMAEYSEEDAVITTIEKYEKRIPIAKENIAKSEFGNKITLMEGDATEILPTLVGRYDFIFMDAAKGQYIHFLPEVMRLLEDGGMLITDNVLQDGDVMESRYAVCRRNRTIHTRMRDYLYELKHNPLLDTVILTVGDGISVSVKKPVAKE